MEESGSSKRKRRGSKANTADQEDRNGPKQDKDKALRDNRNKCWIKVEDFIDDVMDDDHRIRSTSTWEGKKEIVERAHKRLQDPLVMLQRLEKMEPSIMRSTDLKKAFQKIESFLKRSKNPVTNQEYSDGINGMDKTLQDYRKDLQSYKNQLMQKNAICDHKQQSAEVTKAFGNVSGMLSKVTESCCGKMYDDIVNPSNPIRGNFVQIEDEQLVFYFPPSPDSTKIKLHGKNDENSNSGMIDQEEPEKEVNFTVASVGERVVKLALKMQNNDLDVILQTLPNAQMSNHTSAQCALDNLPGSVRHTDWGEGTSNSRANEANMVMSCCLTSMVRSYCINPSYAKVLTEIVQNHPDFDKKFLVQLPYFQNVFMNSLAGSYHSIESNSENFELDDIKIVELIVKDLELTGLELSWIKEKLESVRKMVRKRLREELDSYRAKEKETELKLAMLE